MRKSRGSSVEKVRPGDAGYIPTRSIKTSKFQHDLPLKGRFHVEHWRKNKAGVAELLREIDMPNGITGQGKEWMFKVLFRNSTPITPWYNLLISGAGFTALAVGDVYAQINGTNAWDEFVDYTDGNNGDSATTRPEWVENAPSTVGATTTIANTTVGIFNITATGTVKGIGTVGGGSDADLKNDTATTGGILWGTALFTGGDVSVILGDQLKSVYSVTA